MSTNKKELVADSIENGVKAIHDLIGVVMQTLTEIEELNFKPSVNFPPPECLSPTSAATFAIPPDDIVVQDSYTRILNYRDRYDELKNQIADTILVMHENQNVVSKNNEMDSHEIQQLLRHRDQLRHDVYKRNLVIKDLIDRIRELQLSINLMQGKPQRNRGVLKACE